MSVEVDDEEMGSEPAELDEQEELNDDVDVLSGEDALVACASMLYQKLCGDEAFEKYCETVDVMQLAAKIQKLLGGIFAGDNALDWPAIRMSPTLIDDCYEDFQSILLEALDSNEGDGALLDSMDALTSEEMIGDERMQRFLDHIRSAALEEDDDAETAVDELNEAAQAAAKDAAGTDISVNSFEELVLPEEITQAANDAWRLFISTASSREAAGEAIYAALFESAPSLQSLFVTPRAVQAMRFMSGLASFVGALSEPPKLKILVETLGFGHLHLDVTVPRVIIFRDAIIDLFMVELSDKFDTLAIEGWKKLLNYVGGAIIFVKAHYADRVRCLLKSWKQTNHDASSGDKTGAHGDSSDHENERQYVESKAAKKGGWKAMFGIGEKGKDSMKGNGSASAQKAAKAGEKGNGKGGGKGKDGEHAGGGASKAEDSKSGKNVEAQSVPTTYPEMFMFNAAVMGFGQNTWMNEILDVFDNIVTNVANSARLQEECDILALRLARVVKGNLNLGEYKSCMLASLRSLLPKDWDSAHEVAWTWLWENVERLLMRVHGQPVIWERALYKILGTWDEEQRFEIRKQIYNTFFTLAPAGQDFFKQSNTYLHFIADKIINMTLEIYQSPIKMVDDISALGLRHVGYAIPTELFGPFVSACVEVLMTITSDETTVESFRWSLGLIAKMLVRTITEGSTIVMKAINANSKKMVKKAVACAPRGERAAWMLVVQVGTQSISPLAWSVEAGNLEAAVAIIEDLLTIRADRDRYYFGVDELFKRHPDIIKILCDQAPDLVPKLLDGLIWRSRTTDGAMRRVNYYVKHLLADEDGNFAKMLLWTTNTRDPKLVCHPVIVLVADIVWTRVAFRSFLYGKSWFFFTLLVFITSQSVIRHLHEGENTEVESWLVAICRAFIYLLSMTQLLYSHLKNTISSYRKKNTFKLLGLIPIPNYLKQWQDAANFFLAISLLGMLCLEPILWCWTERGDHLFYENCPEHRKNLRYTYCVFSTAAIFLYYALLIDCAVVSTRVSAFSLACVRMLSEVGLFLGAVAMAILAFSCSMSVVKHESGDFAGIHKGAYSLVRIVMGVYDAQRYEHLEHEPTLLIMVFVFAIITVIFFLNMLIAQLSCAYSSVYADMVGYARLERAETIVELMPSVPKRRWQGFLDTLKLNKRLEFNQGDVGLAGGIQIREAANINPTTLDMIKRFGGSTSPEIQWPEDEADGEVGDRFERIEMLIRKTLQRVAKSGGHRKKGGAGGTSSGMGSSIQTGSIGESADHSGTDDADE